MVSGSSRPVRELDPTIPAALAAVLEKAVAIQRDQRYESAAAFARDLRRWLTGEPVEAVPAGRWRRLIKRVERHPIAATVAVCAVVAVATLGATVLSTFIYMQWWWWRNSEPALVSRIDRNVLDVASRSGRVLATVRLEEGTISWARFASSPETGEPMLVLGVHTVDTREQPSLRAFDLSGKPRELWSWRPDFPAWAREMYAHGPTRLSAFDGHLVRIEDVFPEQDGGEVISVHHHAYYSQSCLAVHTLRGELLYLLWHEGYIFDFRRLPGSDVYVVAAVDCRGEWRDRQPHLPEGNAAAHPITAFGVVPALRSLNDVLVPGVVPRPASARWYSVLNPPGHVLHYSIGARGKDRFRDLESAGDEPALAFYIDRVDLSTGRLEDAFGVEWAVFADGRMESLPLSPLWQQRLDRGPVEGDPRKLHWTMLRDEH